MIKNPTIAIITKRYAVSLVNKKFELLDIVPSKQRPGEFVYVFERSDELLKVFDELINEYHAKRNNGLNKYEARLLIGVLEGYEIEEEDKLILLEKLEQMTD